LWVASSRGKLPRKKFGWSYVGIFGHVVLGRGVYFCLRFANPFVAFGFQLYREFNFSFGYFVLQNKTHQKQKLTLLKSPSGLFILPEIK